MDRESIARDLQKIKEEFVGVEEDLEELERLQKDADNLLENSSLKDQNIIGKLKEDSKNIREKIKSLIDGR